MPPAPDFCVWLHDGAAGNRRQAEALALALGLPAREWRLAPRAPWRWLAPRRLPGAESAFGPEFHALLQQPPALVIGCGRQAALATRLLRGRGSRAVQILDPRIDPRHWDALIAPQHDGLRGAQVLCPLGSLNPIDDAWLAQARAQFAPLAALPSPRTAVLLGGKTAAVRFDRGAFERLVDKLEVSLAQQGGSLLVLGSRRTPPHIADLARSYWADVPGLRWFGPDEGPNPYAGVMAWADRFVVSPDSVNMISEACATHAPVFVAEPSRARGRVRPFLDALLARGRIRAQDRALAPFTAEPLRESARIAQALRDLLGLSAPPPAAP